MSSVTNNTELVPMMVCTQPPVTSENLMDLQQRVNTIIEMISRLPKTPESVPQVKKARADLRRYFDSLDEQRKAVKAAVMADSAVQAALAGKTVCKEIYVKGKLYNIVAK